MTELGAEDFEIRDNGDLREIAFVADSTSPIDLTIAVDTSVPADEELQRFVDDVVRLEGALDPEDRVRLFTFDMRLLRQLSWARPVELSGLPGLSAGGRGTHADALAATLIARPNPGRRHLVALFTDGHENHSGVDLSRVVELAGRAHVMLVTYVLEPSRPLEHPGQMDRNGNIVRRASSVFRPVRIPKAFADRMEAIEESARRTGGEPRDYGGNTFSSLRDLLDEFRRGYVLYFRPATVDDGRWHDLKVSVRTRDGARYRVNARTGYSSIAASPALPVSGDGDRGRVVADRRAPRTETTALAAPLDQALTPTGDEVLSIIESYAAGEHASAAAAMRAFEDQGEAAALLESIGMQWIRESDLASASFRRLVLAALALELAAPSYPIPFVKVGRYSTWSDDVRPVIRWANDLLSRNLTVHGAERAWYLAAVAGLQGMLAFRHDIRHRADAEGVLAQAIKRVPSEARLRWADAIMVEQLWDARAVTRRARPDEVVKAYQTASTRADDDLRAEIQIHLVSRFLDANLDAEALGPIIDEPRRAAAQEALARVGFAEGLTDDPFLAYMCRFFRARIYDRLDRRAEAEAAYRSALDLYPRAQSASMPLATLLFLRGEEASAQALVDAVLASGGADDPWRIYFLHDYRRLPEYLAEMRSALRK